MENEEDAGDHECEDESPGAARPRRLFRSRLFTSPNHFSPQLFISFIQFIK